MSSFGSSSNDSEFLNENNLPIELQSRNIVSSSYVYASTVPPNNGSPIVANISYNGVTRAEPYVEIIEQPQQRGFRFRYECEGPSHGGLQGTKSERSRKSYPTVKIWNYTGAARVVVSLVTDEKNPRSHAHKLVGSNCKNGLCSVEIKSNTEPVSFPNLSILHVTRKKLIDVLTERILDSIKLNKKIKINNMNLDPPLSEEDLQTAKKQAEDQSKVMQLNVVRLCFQVFLRNADGSFSTMLTPVVSQPIYDSKSPGASALKICRMDKYGGCCSGNEEVFLLCEKVQKDDIQVRFVEQNPDGSVKWEAYGNFGPLDVHRQYAIVFKTPAYWNTNIDKAVNVLIMLQRKSDQEVSEPKAFTYFPQNRDKDNIASKKRKRIPLDGYDFGGDSNLGGAGMGGNGGLCGGNSPSGGGMTGGLEGNNSGSMMTSLQCGSVSVLAHRGGLPTTVEEVVKEEYVKNQTLLESDRLLLSLQSTVVSHDFDPWLNDDHDVEVDAAIMPTNPAVSTVVEHPDRLKDVPSSKSFSKPTKVLPREHPDKNGGKSYSNMTKIWSQEHGDMPVKPDVKNLLVESSTDWIDSGVVDPDSGKCTTSLDEKKLVAIVKDYGQQLRTHVAKPEEVKDEPGAGSDLLDNPSRSEGRGEMVSEGVRSDEGFSETSEDMAVKGQLVSPVESKAVPVFDNSVPAGQCGQLTEIARKVTGRVAERTLAALVDFAETGDIRHLLLVQRHLLAISNGNGDLPLHLSVINSQMEALVSLVDVMLTLPGAEQLINFTNFLNQTALHLATLTRQNKMVEHLLHAGADPTIADRNGNSAAHLAVLNDAHMCLKTLVRYLRPGRSSSSPFPELNYLNYDGYSPVHLAALAGNVDMLQILVFGRADVDLPDGKSGKTALHHAVENDDIPVAGYLLMEAGADVNARCFDGNTALHIACARQLVGMVALLVTAGADLECENEEIPDPEPGDGGAPLFRRGLKPADYADDNEQILQILYSELDPNKDISPLDDVSAKMSHVLVGSWHSSTSDSRQADLEMEHLNTNQGKLNSLSSKTRLELSRLLDPALPGRDVFALADKLGYPNLISTLEKIRSSDTSPTTFLLEYFELESGNVSLLAAALESIGRTDVSSRITL